MDGNSTHLPVLGAVREIMMPQTVIEYGCGHFSTPWLLEHMPLVTSIELRAEWVDKVKLQLAPHLANRWTPVVVEDELAYTLKYYPRADMMLIDGGNATARPPLATVCMRNNLAAVIAMHDTESPGYGWANMEIPEGWLYVEVQDYGPWTSVALTDEHTAQNLKSKFQRAYIYRGPGVLKEIVRVAHGR